MRPLNLIISALCVATCMPVARCEVPSPQRVEELAAMLPEVPAAAGPSIRDRQAWATFPRGSVVTDADRMLSEPTPELNDELYLMFSRKDSRKEYEVPYNARVERLTAFTVAECVIDEGRYLAAVQQELSAILAEKTWSMPAHDKKLAKFHGTLVDVDLGVAMRGATVANAVSWLGEKLPGELRSQAMDALQARLFTPYQQLLSNPASPLCAWTRVDHNWNSVCHAGVVIAALAVLPSRQDRAQILAGAERYLRNYMNGFTPDGYCSEGMAYWNYGFGHYVLLAETALQATGGKLDFYQDERIQHIAAYADKLALAQGVYPAFADSPVNPQPSPWLQRICAERLFGASPNPANTPLDTKSPLLYQVAVTEFPLIPRSTNLPEASAKLDPLRGWFPDALVLVARPANQTADSLSAAILGGNNGDNHNHNDIGQFVVQFRGQLPLIDPGMDRYTAGSFGPNRYDSEMLNSLGHSVPTVAGKLQRSGKQARARLVSSEFSPERDYLLMDISSAYQVPELTKLERAFTYTRKGAGELEIRDQFQFTSPQSFESSMVTMGSMRLQEDKTLLFTDGEASLRVEVSTGGAPYEVIENRVDSTRVKDPLRVTIRLKEPSVAGTVTFQISPAP